MTRAIGHLTHLLGEIIALPWVTLTSVTLPVVTPEINIPTLNLLLRSANSKNKRYSSHKPYLENIIAQTCGYNYLK